MTTPPDFGGHEIEEGLLEDLGGPAEHHPVSHQDGPPLDDNEAHAPGQVCQRCGAVITPGQDGVGPALLRPRGLAGGRR